MPEVVSIREDLQLIQVTSTDHVSQQDLYESLATILQFQQACGMARIYVDLTAATSFPPAHQIYEFGLKASRQLQDSCVAVLVSPPLRDDLVFFSHVMQNRGRHAKVFEAQESVMEWLDEMPVWCPGMNAEPSSLDPSKP